MNRSLLGRLGGRGLFGWKAQCMHGHSGTEWHLILRKYEWLAKQKHEVQWVGAGEHVTKEINGGENMKGLRPLRNLDFLLQIMESYFKVLGKGVRWLILHFRELSLVTGWDWIRFDQVGMVWRCYGWMLLLKLKQEVMKSWNVSGAGG